MSSRCRSFQQVRFTNEFFGYPCIAAVGQYEAVVGDWTGKLRRVTLSPFALQSEAFVGTEICGNPSNNILCSLAPSPRNHTLCAVATRGSLAAVWNSLNAAVVHVYAESGPVHSVAWLDNSSSLLLGIGDYSLSSAIGRQAAIEVWNPAGEEPALLTRVALPGTCVDAIAVRDDYETEIVAFSGMKSQQQGFVSILNAYSLLPQMVVELPLAAVHRIECSESLVVVCHRGEVRGVNRADGSTKWSHTIADSGADFAWDTALNHLLLSNGELISATDGRVLAQWPVLDGCCSLRPRPEGGFVGVSQTGVIGVWDV